MKNTILIQANLKPVLIEQLEKELSQYRILLSTDITNSNLTNEDWAHVEILYGSRLTTDQLKRAPLLRWIHSPTLSLKRLCMDEITAQGNILITTVSEENSIQVGEFVVGAILAFAKHLIDWKSAMSFPNVLWESKWRDSMWSLQNRKMIQIGFGKAGTEIARRAQQQGLEVWGVQEKQTFHPYCHKTFAENALKEILPHADIVCICIPGRESKRDFFRSEELHLMKEDSILIVIGPHDIVNAEDLAQVAATGKFRGILFDAPHRPAISLKSPLWNISGLLITPDVSSRPKAFSKQAFQAFHYNLRQYLHGNFGSLRNHVAHD
jgi:D-2-hydroxyacid dehydrogenase (NADP+)